MQLTEEPTQETLAPLDDALSKNSKDISRKDFDEYSKKVPKFRIHIMTLNMILTCTLAFRSLAECSRQGIKTGKRLVPR